MVRLMSAWHVGCSTKQIHSGDRLMQGAIWGGGTAKGGMSEDSAWLVPWQFQAGEMPGCYSSLGGPGGGPLKQSSNQAQENARSADPNPEPIVI